MIDLSYNKTGTRLCDYFKDVDNMIDYREILRLNSLEYNNTEIASCVHISRGPVQNLLEVTSKMEIRWPLDDVNTRVLQSLIYPDRYKKDDNRLVPDYPKIHRNLAKKGFTLTLP